MYKIIYLTGTVNAEAVYDSWAKQHDIPNDPDHRMKVIPYASSREIFATYLTHGNQDGILDPDDDYDVNHVPSKLFLSWNRRFRQHRILLALILEKLNVVDRSLISFPKNNVERLTDSFIHNVENLDQPITVYGRQDYEFDQDLYNRFDMRLPLVIDGETDINKMCEDFGFTKEHYKNTLVSIVTETNFDAVECTLTEKSFKPILHKHPFIIVGVPGALRGLRDLGFQTFGEFWDERYDSTQDPGSRMIQISNIISEIASWDENKIRDFRQKVKPILQHNYNLLKIPGSILIVNNMYNHITDHFESEEHHATCQEVKCHAG